MNVYLRDYEDFLDTERFAVMPLSVVAPVFTVPPTNLIAIQHWIHGLVVALTVADAELFCEKTTFAMSNCHSYAAKNSMVMRRG